MFLGYEHELQIRMTLCDIRIYEIAAKINKTFAYRIHWLHRRLIHGIEIIECRNIRMTPRFNSSRRHFAMRLMNSYLLTRQRAMLRIVLISVFAARKPVAATANAAIVIFAYSVVCERESISTFIYVMRL